MVVIIGWIIFLSILAFFVLLFSVRVSFNMELNENFSLSVRAFGIKINIYPKKEKKYKISDYTPKKIAKREAKAAKKKAKRDAKKAKRRSKRPDKSKLTKEEKRALKKKKKESRPAMGDMISFFAEIAKLLFSTFFSHLHVKTSKIHIRVGGSDAAQTALLWYGVYASCTGIMAFLDKHSNLHGKQRADIQIVPDYLSEKIEADLKLSLSMNLFGALCVLLKVGIRALTRWIKITPQKPSHTPTQSTSPAPQNQA